MCTGSPYEILVRSGTHTYIKTGVTQGCVLYPYLLNVYRKCLQVY